MTSSDFTPLPIGRFAHRLEMTTTSSALLGKHFEVFTPSYIGTDFSHHCTSGESSSHMTSSEFADQDPQDTKTVHIEIISSSESTAIMQTVQISYYNLIV